MNWSGCLGVGAALFLWVLGGAAQALPSDGTRAEPSSAAPTAVAEVPKQAALAGARLRHVRALQAEAKGKRLWDAEAWLRLGHYRKGMLGGFESEVDGAAFFLDAGGKSDPQGELLTTIERLFDPDSYGAPDAAGRQEPALCRFPARLLWLADELALDGSLLPRAQCEGFSRFARELEPQAITLVFSSYFLNNPASAFGHTFLRVQKGRAGGEERQALLDYGIDFAARVDTSNAIVYAAKGLLGLFPGVYHRVPYYYKVREYNDFESRDLWEYELSLTPAQVTRVVAHIWELGSTYFDYYYLSENCSYHILGALEVADPELHLLEHVNWPAVPVDTLRALYKNPGLVREVRYRPSGRTQFSERLKGLDSEEVDSVASLLSDPDGELPQSLSADAAVRVLDAALDVVDNRFADQLVKSDSERDREAGDAQQKLLLRRAQMLVRSEPFEISPPVRLEPQSGHMTRRVQMGSGYSPQRGAFHQLRFRLALHDMADPPRGYPESAQIQFFSLGARYFAETPKLWLEDFTLVQVTSVTPITRFESPLSWTMRFGWQRSYDSGCRGCLAAGGEVGGGGSVGFADNAVLLYAFALSHIEGLAPIRGGLFDLPLRVGVGPAGGLRLRFSDNLVGLGQARLLFQPGQSPATTWRVNGDLRYQYLNNFAFGAELVAEGGERRLGASSIIYF